MHIVIIGSGVAGVTFAEKYRSLDTGAKITLVTRETDGYYSRPLLSRGFSKETIEQSIILKPFDALRDNKIELICGAEMTAIADLNTLDRRAAIRQGRPQIHGREDALRTI